VATGDFGSGRMPPDMFYNCNEEIKRQKEQTIRSQNMQISRICSRDRDRVGDRGRCAELGGFGRGNLNLIDFRGINAPLFGGSYGRSWHSYFGRYRQHPDD
jgi:hypothetical protein